MDASREKYLLMSKKMSTKGAEKFRGKLFSAVFPTVWLIKLRSIRRNSRSLKGSDTTKLVIPDSMPFLPQKVVENCYKHGALKSRIYNFSPPEYPQAVTNIEHSNPWLECRDTNRVIPSSRSSMKNKMASSKATSRFTPIASLANATSSRASMLSRCLSKETFSSRLRDLCKLVGDKSSSRKGSNTSKQFRKTTSPTGRAWFLVGCGGTPLRRSCRNSLQIEKESVLIGMDTGSGLDCIEDGRDLKDFWPTKTEPGLRANSIVWSGEPKNGKVVKNQMIMKKFSRNMEVKGLKVNSPANSKTGSNPTLGHLLFAESDTAFLKINPETTEVPDAQINNLEICTYPTSTIFGTDCNMKAPQSDSECRLGPLERKLTSFLPDLEPPANCTEGFDDTNFSDCRSLPKQKELPAHWQLEGSELLKEHQKTSTIPKDEREMRLLASLHQTFDRRNLQKLIGDEDDVDPGNVSMLESPTGEPHNSHVFEIFLESSAKAWGVKFPIPEVNIAESNKPVSASDKSRELHCITEHPAPKLEEPREISCERNKTEGKISLAARNNPTSFTKRQKAKYPHTKKGFKKLSPSRKLVRKDAFEERTSLAHWEESMIDPELHEDLNLARRKFTEARRRTKQRRSKQIASVPSPPTSSTKQLASVSKERVAIVVESSNDPYNDFRQSMIEMIVDQDVKEADDLEELLQCYLSLNEAEHHNVIVDVFTDVWYEIFGIKS